MKFEALIFCAFVFLNTMTRSMQIFSRRSGGSHVHSFDVSRDATVGDLAAAIFPIDPCSVVSPRYLVINHAERFYLIIVQHWLIQEFVLKHSLLIQ